MKKEIMLSTAQTALLLGASLSAVRGWIKKEEIKSVKTGHYRHIPLSQFDRQTPFTIGNSFTVCALRKWSE